MGQALAQHSSGTDQSCEGGLWSRRIVNFYRKVVMAALFPRFIAAEFQIHDTKHTLTQVAIITRSDNECVHFQARMQLFMVSQFNYLDMLK